MKKIRALKSGFVVEISDKVITLVIVLRLGFVYISGETNNKRYYTSIFWFYLVSVLFYQSFDMVCDRLCFNGITRVTNLILIYIFMVIFMVIVKVTTNLFIFIFTNQPSRALPCGLASMHFFFFSFVCRWLAGSVYLTDAQAIWQFS